MFESRTSLLKCCVAILAIGCMGFVACARQHAVAPPELAPSAAAPLAHELVPAYEQLREVGRLCAWAHPLEVDTQLDASEMLVHRSRLGCDDLAGALEAIHAADRALDVAEPTASATPAMQWWRAARVVCPSGPISLEPIAPSPSGGCHDPAAIHFAWLARIAVAEAGVPFDGFGSLGNSVGNQRTRALYGALLDELVVPPRDGYEAHETGVDETTLIARDASGFERGRIIVSIHRAFSHFDVAREPMLPKADASLGIVASDRHLDDEATLRGLLGKRDRGRARRLIDGREGTSLRIARPLEFGTEVRIAAFEIDGPPRSDPWLDAFARGIVAAPRSERVARLAAVLDPESITELHRLAAMIAVSNRLWQTVARVFAAADRTSSESELAGFLDSLPATGPVRNPCDGRAATDPPRPIGSPLPDPVRTILEGGGVADPRPVLFVARARDMGLEEPTRIVLQAYGPTCGESYRYMEFAFGIVEGKLIASQLPYIEDRPPR